jgi:hypothetical protein
MSEITQAVEAEEPLEAVEEIEPSAEAEVGNAGGEPVEKTQEPAVGDQNQEAEEVEVSIGDSPSQQEESSKEAPTWVKDLRKQYRELQREKRQLEERVRTMSTETNPVAQLGPKPSLEGCDYDSAKYEESLEAWFVRKRAVDAEAEKAERAKQAEAEEWQKKLANYAETKTKLKVADYSEAEAAVQDVLNVTQQGILLQGSENPALLVYALGRNPAKAKELASINDPVKFAFAVSKIETQLKVTPKKTAPPPERTISGTAKSSGGSDEQLDRLREQAARTGDFSKVLAYKNQLKNK